MKMATLRFNKGRKSSHMPIISGLSAFKTKNFSLPETCPLFILCWQLYWDYINKTMSLLQCIIWHQTKKERKTAQSSFVFFFNFMCQMHSVDANVAMTDNFTSMDNMAPDFLSSFNFMCRTQSTDASASKTIMAVPQLKIGRFSCSLAKLFLAPPYSCSVSGI